MENKTEPARHHAGYKVIGVLLLLATAIGVTAYARFVQSEKHLTSTFEYFTAVGDSQTALGCVDEVIAWSSKCSAMLSLCEDSVQRMMSGCLHGNSGANRAQECADVAEFRRKTSFGYEDCQSRSLDRTRKRACADSYRAIDKYCEDLAAR